VRCGPTGLEVVHRQCCSSTIASAAREPIACWLAPRLVRRSSVRALVAGDSPVGFGAGFALNEWLVTREQVVERLRPLLALPVEVVVPAHGAPTDRAGLERALLHRTR
jgi:hypothetical protein